MTISPPKARRCRPRWFIHLALTVLVFAGPRNAGAMSVAPPSFEELVDESAGIVRAEVIDVTPFRTTSRDGSNIIKTRVTWRVVTTLKGAGAQTLTLEFLGGRVGSDRLRIGGMPTFARGDMDFLFVEANTGVICPLIAAGHGRYRVLTDPETRREYVARDNRAPLATIAEVAAPPAPATSGAVSPESFEQLITSTLNRTEGGPDGK